MRFYSYLNEALLTVDDFQKMAKDCKPFLKRLKRNNFDWFIFSGRKGTYKPFEKIKIRKNRKPKDMPEIIHNALDEEFRDRFGVKARSQSFFVLMSPQATTEYGKPHYVFPVGDYKLIYSYKIDDLYRYLDMRFARDLDVSMDDIAPRFQENPDDEHLGISPDEWEDYLHQIVRETVSMYTESKEVPLQLPLEHELMLITSEARLFEWDIDFEVKHAKTLKQWIWDTV